MEPGTLGMCALASRSFSMDSVRPLVQCGLLGDAVSCGVTLPSFLARDASFSFAAWVSLVRPLCSASRTSKCFPRPETALRCVSE